MAGLHQPAALSPAAGIGGVVILDGGDDRRNELEEQHHVAAAQQASACSNHLEAANWSKLSPPPHVCAWLISAEDRSPTSAATNTTNTSAIAVDTLQPDGALTAQGLGGCRRQPPRCRPAAASSPHACTGGCPAPSPVKSNQSLSGQPVTKQLWPGTAVACSCTAELSCSGM